MHVLPMPQLVRNLVNTPSGSSSSVVGVKGQQSQLGSQFVANLGNFLVIDISVMVLAGVEGFPLHESPNDSPNLKAR
jgi:hypothetical protein